MPALVGEQGDMIVNIALPLAGHRESKTDHQQANTREALASPFGGCDGLLDQSQHLRSLSYWRPCEDLA